MIGQIADVVGVFEVEREGGGVVGLAAHATCRLRAAHEVVLVVADLRAGATPARLTLHGVDHREHYRLHA